MTRFFQINWKNLGVLAQGYAVVILFLISCSSGVKEITTLGWKVEIVAGSEQITLPRRAYSSPVEIVVKTSNGQPVVDAAMEFRLVDQQLIGERDITNEVLATAWSSESARLTSTDPAVRSAAAAEANAGRTGGTKAEVSIEERIGRIDQFDPRTNREGKAKAWVIAPTLFDKTIAVLAKAGNDPSMSGSYSYALLRTSNYGDGARLSISTTNSKKEVSGAEFDIFLTIADVEGRIATSFNETRKIKIDASPKTSWAGVKPNFPSGESECRFSGGMCVLPRGPFILRVPEELAVTVTILDSKIAATTDKITVTADPERANIALKNAPGIPTESNTIIDQISLVAGRSINLYAAWIDKSGNYLDEVASATWSIDSARLLEGLSVTTGRSVTFAPTKTGTGFLTVTADNKGLLKMLPVVVPANELHSWRFRINGEEPGEDSEGRFIPPAVKANTCFDVDLIAADLFGNIVPTADGDHFITLRIENANSGVVLKNDAHWGELEPDDEELTDFQVKLTEGVAKNIQKACVYDATFSASDAAPRLTASGKLNTNADKIFTGSLELNIQKNIPRRIILTRADVNYANYTEDNAVNICTRETQEVGIKPCMVMQAATPEYFKAALVDGAGNFIKYVDVTATDEDSKMVITHTPDSGTKRFQFSPSQTGSGRILIQYDESSGMLSALEKSQVGASNLSLRYDYKIVANSPSAIVTRLDTDLNDTIDASDNFDAGLNEPFIQAGNSFKVIAKLVDENGTWVQDKRVFVNSSRHISLSYYAVSPLNDTVAVDEAYFTSSGLCHRKTANTPVPQEHADTQDNQSNKSATLIGGLIRFTDPADTFKLMRATNSFNGNCTTTLIMRVRIGNRSEILSTPANNTVSVKAKPIVSEIRFKTEENNNGEDMNASTECNNNTSSYIQPFCHELLIGGAKKQLHIAAFDQYKNYLTASSNVNTNVRFSWINTPSLENYQNYPDIGSYNVALNGLSADVKYQLRHASDLITNAADPTLDEVDVKIRVGTGQARAVEDDGLSPAGSGYVLAQLDSNPLVKVQSKVYNFMSDVARKYVVDFINPTESAINPQVYWSSADGAAAGNVASARQIPAGVPFAIRIRPVDNGYNPIKAYRDTKNLRISIPESTSWGNPAGLSLQAIDKNTSVNGTTVFDFDCDFQVPPGLKYTGSITKIANNYTVLGPYTTGTECIIKNGGTIRQFSLLNSRFQHSIILADNNPSTTLDGPTIVTVQPIANTTESRKINAASRCGGPDNGASLWFLGQSGITKSTIDNSVKKITANKYQMTSDESLAFYPVITDQSGNYISDIAFTSPATLTESTPPSSNDTITSTESTDCAGSQKISFVANTATSHLFNSARTLSFAHSVTDPANHLQILIEILPGEPNSLDVKLVPPRFVSSDPILPPTPNPATNFTEVIAGSCFSPVVRVVDSDGNQVRTLGGAVEAHYGLEDYYNSDPAQLATKELIHPGGLYRYQSPSIYIPITDLDTSVYESDLISKDGSAWLTPLKYSNPSVMDGVTREYRGSEKSDKLIVGGDMDLIGRYVCLMDATPGLDPNFKVAVNLSPGGVAKWVYGSSKTTQTIRVSPGAAALIDFRQVVAGDKQRLCQAPFSKTGFPFYQAGNQGPGFYQNNSLSCRSLGVTNSSIVIEAYFTDAVGNYTTVGSHLAGTAVGSWNVDQVPLNTQVCGSANGNGSTCTTPTLTLDNLVTKGTIAIDWSLPAGLTDVYGSREIDLVLKSGQPDKIAVSSNLNATTSDSIFGFNIKLLDEFDNEFDPPAGFSYPVTATVNYTGLFSTSASAASPDPGDTLPNLMPTTVSLLFSNSNTASTSNIFRFRRANGADAAGITFSMKPTASSVLKQASFPLTINPGTPFKNDVYYSDTAGPNVNVKLISLETDPTSTIHLTSGSGFQQFEVRSLDRAGNVTDSPPVNFAFTGATALPAFVAVPSVPYSAKLPLIKSGNGIFRAALTNQPGLYTDTYKVIVAAADASKLTLVRVDADGNPLGTNTPLNAGEKIFFKIVATDDQDNIVEQFEHANVAIQWNYDRYPQRPEGIRARLPGCSTDSCVAPVTIPNGCQFVEGVCRSGNTTTDPVQIFEATLYGATGASPGYLEATANVSSGYSGSFGFVVLPSAFHHFGVNPGVNEIDAKADKSALFNLTVDARDEFGNRIVGSQLDPLRSAGVNLIIRRDDGVTAASGTLANIPATPPNIGASADVVTFSGLAYDEPGSFRIFASKTDNSAMSTLGAAPVILFRAVESTIQKYRLVFTGGVNDYTAGQQNTFRLEAIDNYDNPVRGIDNILRTHVYEWNGLFGSETVFGVSRPADIMPVQFNNVLTGQFKDGVAAFKGTLYRAGNNYQATLQLKNKKTTISDLTDDELVENYAPTAITAIRVLPAELNSYNIIATANDEGGLTSLAANSTLSASSAATGKFRIVVQPLDTYGNLRIGEAGVFLHPDKGANSLTASVARKVGDTAFAILPLNLVSGMAPGIGFVYENLYYRVAQPVNWTLSGTSGTLTIVPSVTLNYIATQDTVNTYRMLINGSENAANIQAGNGFTLTLEALDEVGNVVSGSGLGAALSSLTFSATGPESILSHHPTPLTSFTFTDSGVAEKTNVQFFKAQTLLAGTFVVSESGSTRKASNSSTLTIEPGVVESLEYEPIPPQKAGMPYTVTIAAYDGFKNHSNSGCADPANNQTYPINVKGVASDGTTADSLTSSGAGGGTATPAFTNATLGIDINQVSGMRGIYQQSLTLFKRGENHLLFSGCNETALATVIVNESDKANNLRLNNSSSAPAASLSIDQECTHPDAISSNVVCPSIYAFMWDQYGNVWRDGEGSCTWTYTNLVPSSPLSPAGNVTGLVALSPFQTLISDKHMSGNLRCTVAAANSITNNPIYADVRLYGGLAGLGGRDADNNLVTTNVTTDPSVFGAMNPIPVGSENLRITKITLLQYRGGSVNTDGTVATYASPLATNRTRTEEYSFESTGTIDANLLPTNLVRNHSATGDLDGEFVLSLNRAMQGDITIEARGVSSTLSNIVVGVGSPASIRVGRFMVGGVEKQSVTAGDLITLEWVKVYDAMGNLVCNGDSNAIIEAAELMTPAVCGSDLNCSSLDSTLPGAKPTDFDTYALKNTSNQKSFDDVAAGEWSNLQFKLYRSSLAFRLSVKACGLTSDHVFSVSAAQLAHARLAASDDAPSAAVQLPEVKCPLGDGLGVRCPTIKGFYWDNYGNSYSSGTCTSWSYDRASTNSVAAGAGAGEFALAANNTNKTTITTGNLNYLSGRLNCQAATGVEAKALVYGGLTSLSASYTFGTGAGTEAVAGENNFTVTSVTANFKKPTEGSGGVLSETELPKDDFPTDISETISYGTPSGSLTTANLPIANNSTSFACLFSNSGVCNPTGLPAKLSFRKVESPRTISLSLRGKVFSIANLVATPNKATSIDAALYQNTSDENTKITATSAMQAGTSVGAIVRVYDEYQNLTSKYGTSLDDCTVGNNDITGIDSQGITIASQSRLTSAERRLTSNSVGVYKIAQDADFGAAGIGLTINKADTHTITFSLCGETTTKSVKVIPAAHTHTRVTLSATPPADPSTFVPLRQRCALNINGSGVACDTAYAWYYDAFFNKIDGLVCPNWSYAARDTDHDSSPSAVRRSLETGSNSTQVTSTDFMDGDLTCDFTGTAKDASVHLYGGLHSIAAVHGAIGSSIEADENNITLSKLVLKGPSYNNSGTYSLAPYPVAVANIPVAISTTATQASLGTSLPVVTPSFTCNFDTNGECTTPNTVNAFNLNFTKAQSAVTFTVEARGKSYSPGDFEVTSANADAAQSTFTVVDSSNNARPTHAFNTDEIFGLNIAIKDKFGNPTDRNKDTDTTCTATNSTTIDSSSIGNNGAGDTGFTDNNTGATNQKESGITGSYRLRGLRISSVGSNPLEFTTCGVAKEITFNVSAGAAYEFYLNSTAAPAKTNTAVLPCTSLIDGGGTTCPIVYAHFYDQFGNHRANDTCDSWSLTPKSADTSNPWSGAQGASASVQVMAMSVLDATLVCSKADVAGVTPEVHVYGGFKNIKVVVTDSRDGDGLITADQNNFRVDSITLRGYMNGALTNANYTGSYQIRYSTTASGGPNGTTFTSTPEINCSFTSGECSTAKSFTFAKADSSAQTLAISVKGVNVVSTAEGDGGKLTTIKVKPGVPTSHTTTLPTQVLSTDTFGGGIHLFDEFLNPSCDDANLTYTAPAGTTSPNGTIATSGAASKSTTGVYTISNTAFKLPLVTSTGHSLQFAGCGYTVTHNIKVNEGALHSIKLLDSTTRTPSQVHAETALASVTCRHTATSGAGVVCDSIKAHLLDANGNFVNDHSKQCSWNYNPTTLTGSVTTPATAQSTAPASLPSGRLLTMSHTGYLDGTVQCTADAINSTSVSVSGGVSRVAVELVSASQSNISNSSSAGQRTVAAANANIGVWSVNLYSRSAGAEVAASGANYTFSAEPIEIVTTAIKSVMNSADPVVPSNPNCNFTAGLCGGGSTTFATAPLKLSLTRVGSAGANDIAVKVRGVTSNSISMIVTAGVSTNATIDPVSPVAAGSAFNVYIRGFDAFGNQSLNGCTGFSMTGGLTSAASNAPAFSWTSAGFDATTATEVPGASVTLYAKGNHSLTFTGSGCSITATTTVPTNAAAADPTKTLISSTDATSISQIPAWLSNTEATPTDRPCTTLNADNNGVACLRLYAYNYDSYGNATALLPADINNQTCRWMVKTHGSTGWSEWVTSAHAADRSSTSAAPAIDELVKCDGGANHIRLYGGPASLVVVTNPASSLTAGKYVVSGSQLLAGFSNFTLAEVALKSKRAGVEVAMPGLSGNNTQTISLTNLTMSNNSFGASADLSTTSTVYASSIASCLFNSNGQCFPSANMNFKKLEATASDFKVTVRGAEAVITLPRIDPGPAANLEILNLPSTFSVDAYTDASTTIDVTVNAKDQFGNITTTPVVGSANCDLAVTGNEQGIYPDSIDLGTQPSSLAKLKIYKAKSHALSFDKCGLTRAATIEIQAGVARRSMLTQNRVPPTFSCYTAGDTIMTNKTSCSTDVTVNCTASTTAGGATCGNFFAWTFDKAGNPLNDEINDSKDCNSPDVDRSLLFTANAGSGSASYTTVNTGFQISSATASKWLDGTLQCKTKDGTGSNFLGGTKITLLAKVLLNPPVVECTPWIYLADGRANNSTAASTPVSLCQFTNNIGGYDLTFNPTSNADIPISTAETTNEAASILWRSWGSTSTTFQNTEIGQFIIQGEKGKYSRKFRINPTLSTTDATKITLAEVYLRVPTRDNAQLSNTYAGQKTAQDAGINSLLAEIAEDDVSGVANVSYYGATSAGIIRRAGMSVKGSSTTQPGMFTYTGTTGTTQWSLCDSNLRRCSDSNSKYISVFDTTSNVTATTTASERFVIHPLTPFFQTMTTGTCDDNTAIAESTINSCTIMLKYDVNTAYNGLRGIFMIRDSNHYYFYHMTQPIP